MYIVLYRRIYTGIFTDIFKGIHGFFLYERGFIRYFYNLFYRFRYVLYRKVIEDAWNKVIGIPSYI